MQGLIASNQIRSGSWVAWKTALLHSVSQQYIHFCGDCREDEQSPSQLEAEHTLEVACDLCASLCFFLLFLRTTKMMASTQTATPTNVATTPPMMPPYEGSLLEEPEAGSDVVGVAMMSDDSADTSLGASSANIGRGPSASPGDGAIPGSSTGSSKDSGGNGSPVSSCTIPQNVTQHWLLQGQAVLLYYCDLGENARPET